MPNAALQQVGHAKFTIVYGSPMNELKDRIAWALEQAGRQQFELADHLKISRSSVNQWVSGLTKEITPKHLFRVARYLGVTAEWLGSGVGARTPAEQSLEEQEGLNQGKERRARRARRPAQVDCTTIDMGVGAPQTHCDLR